MQHNLLASNSDGMQTQLQVASKEQKSSVRVLPLLGHVSDEATLFTIQNETQLDVHWKSIKNIV